MKDSAFLMAAAKSSTTKPETLTALSETPASLADMWEMDHRLVRNPKTPTKALDNIVRDHLRLDYTKTHHNRMSVFNLEKIAQHPNASHETLNKLVQHPDVSVNHGVLRNPKASSETLEKVLDKYPKDYSVSNMVAQHPNADAKLLHRLGMMSGDRMDTALHVLDNPNTSNETIKILRNEHRNEYVKQRAKNVLHNRGL